MIWLVFSRIFAGKRIYVLLLVILKVKQPRKGNAAVKLEPQTAAFLVNHPKCCQNSVLNAAENRF